MKQNNVLALRADWTKQDPEIGQLLRTFGRIGVPAYVLYPGGSAQPIVLPEILTQQLLLQHLADLKS
jgi:thiol:disulfide interchange protein DsbD